MTIPNWIRYVLLVLVTASLTAVVMYKATNQFVALAMAKNLGSMGKAIAASQKYISEGKIEKANGLLCELASSDKRLVTELTKLVDEGLFPSYAMEAAASADRKYIETVKAKLEEARIRCSAVSTGKTR